MAKLSADQLAFLKRHNISPSMIIDATGLSADRRKTVMSTLQVPFYYGGTPCQAAGHTLRTKPGHCIQCDTAKIAYQLRSSATGHVYLAYSPKMGYIKVGYSRDHPQDRGLFLRNEAYGNIKDWDIKRIQHFANGAGKIEFKIHAQLESYQRSIHYYKGNDLVECREIFLCDLEHAINIFEKVCGNRG